MPVDDARLWASCIGGAAHEREYQEAIENAGLHVESIRRNPYQFLSETAQNASAAYGVKSISLLARKRGRQSHRAVDPRVSARSEIRASELR